MTVKLILRFQDGELFLVDDREYGQRYRLYGEDCVYVYSLFETDPSVYPDQPAREEAARRYLEDLYLNTDPDDPFEIDFDVDDDDDAEFLDSIGYDPAQITLEEFDNAVEQLCDALNADRTSIELGEYEGPSDYKVEIGALGPAIGPVLGDLELGGWVTLQKSDWTIWADIGLAIGGESINPDSSLRAQYDRDAEEWPVLALEPF